MADLTAMYMDLANNSGKATERGFLGAQQMMENQLAYQKAREDLEAQRGLRALFAQNPNATSEEVSRYSPQLGMEMNKYAQETQERSGRMRKTQNDISEQEMKIFSVVGAQVAEKYAPAAMSGQMTPEMLSQFHNEIGNALMQVEQQYGIKPPPANIEQLDPMSVLSRAAPFYKSPVIENMMAVDKERMMSGIPQRPSYTDISGRTESGPLGGTRYIEPPPPPGSNNLDARTQPPEGPKLKPAPILEFQGKTYTGPEFSKEMLAEKDPERKAKMIEYLDAQIVSEKQGIKGSRFISPEEESQLRIDEEKQKADIQTKALGERKAAELDVEKKAAKQKAIEAFSLVPSLKEVEDLIKGSTSGEKQTQMAKAFESYTGETTPGMQKIGRLGVIAGRLRDAVNRAPGNQSDKDAIIESLKTGNIENSELGYAKRMEAYREFVRQMREMIKKETGMDAGSTDGMATDQTPVTVKSRAEVEALPKGTLFMGSDGVVHRRK